MTTHQIQLLQAIKIEFENRVRAAKTGEAKDVLQLIIKRIDDLLVGQQ